MRAGFEIPERCRDCTFVQFCQLKSAELIDEVASRQNTVASTIQHHGLLDKLGAHDEAEQYRQQILDNDAIYAAEAVVLLQDRLEEVVDACETGPRRRFGRFGAQLCQSAKILESKGLNKLYPWLFDKYRPTS